MKLKMTKSHKTLFFEKLNELKVDFPVSLEKILRLVKPSHSLSISTQKLLPFWRGSIKIGDYQYQDYDIEKDVYNQSEQVYKALIKII